MNKPPLFDKWNPAMRGAYVKGYVAAKSGKTIDDCPYQDKRKPSGGLSWSRSFLFINTWRDGFRAGTKDE